VTAEIAGRFVTLLQQAAKRLGDAEPGSALRLAARFGLRGYMSRHVEQLDEEAAAARRLAGMIERNLLDAAAEMSAEFASLGIPHFFVKGIALAGRVYRLGDREMADIDVHVPPAALQEAIGVLRRLGYEPLSERAQGAPASLKACVSLQRGRSGSTLHDVAVDLRGGIDPVDRLLPRPDSTIPGIVWRCLDESGSFPVPADGHHAALIVHHLVHHDMLHLRGLLDVALVWQGIPPNAGAEIERLAAEIGVLRALRVMARLLADHFGLEPRGVSACPNDWRTRRALALLQPVTWFTWAVGASASEFVEASPRRLLRRILLMDDLGAVPRLLEDAAFPPREYLQWRWSRARSNSSAWLRHVIRVVRKSLLSP